MTSVESRKGWVRLMEETLAYHGRSRRCGAMPLNEHPEVGEDDKCPWPGGLVEVRPYPLRCYFNRLMDSYTYAFIGAGFDSYH